MKKSYLVLLGLFLIFQGIAFPSYGDSSKYEITVEIGRPDSNPTLGSAICSIEQTLEWGNHQSIWSCRLGEEKPVTKMFDADSIGYSYDHKAAFAEFNINQSSSLEKYLTSLFGLGELQLEGSGKITHMFFDKAVDITPRVTLVDKVAEERFEFYFHFLSYVD